MPKKDLAENQLSTWRTKIGGPFFEKNFKNIFLKIFFLKSNGKRFSPHSPTMRNTGKKELSDFDIPTLLLKIVVALEIPPLPRLF